MLINGKPDKKRSEILIDKCIEYIRAAKDKEEVSVLLLNSVQKVKFIDDLKKKYGDIPSDRVKIYTLYGLCYNAFIDNSDYIKSVSGINIKDNLNLCGLEVSRYIFEKCIKEADFSDYISKVNLVHQLFRRYMLIVQNSLSDDEVKERSLLLKESFYKEAKIVIDKYKLKTIRCRSFDYLRQLAVLPLICGNTAYFNNIKYLVADDADEYSFAFWNFIDYLIPKLTDYTIAYDEGGSSRCGYLCAYIDGVSEFKRKYSPKETRIPYEPFPGSENFIDAVKSGCKTESDKINVFNYFTRLDMIDAVISDIKKLLQKGVKCSEISIISPVIDDCFTEMFSSCGKLPRLQILSGREKLYETRVGALIISVLKAVNSLDIAGYSLGYVFSELLGISRKKSRKVTDIYAKTKDFPFYDFGNDITNAKYEKFKGTIKLLLKSGNTLSEQIKTIFENLIKENADENDVTKYEFLLKEAESFVTAFGNETDNIAEEFIRQIENSIISENPIEAVKLKKNHIVVATPQKFIDLGAESSYSFWLDISSGEWFKQDSGTLYNAPVFSRDYNGEKYDYEYAYAYTRDKTARIIRKLMNAVSKDIRLYSSVYDASGRENFGGLNEYISSKREKKGVFKIIPRPDQIPVLNYKSGETAVLAVPGAGKTTVLTALVINLIKSGVNPENIFILTYMESAAKNFKERISLAVDENTPLPNVSTIHGLALRIIKENGNAALAGLDDNFEICDESIKNQILNELFYKFKIPEEMRENHIKALSAVRPYTSGKKPVSGYKEIKEFFMFVSEYEKSLKTRNMLDYDDMLVYAVKILEENPDVLEYYRNLCVYVAEDEAQDSTDMQQKLISLLKSKHNNYIRCGDINQAITSTFTDSNLDNFRKFVKEHPKIEMTSSQRCAEPVYSLANSLIIEASKNETTKNAFYVTQMKGTGRNPESGDGPLYIKFNTDKEEKRFIVDKIKEIRKNIPDASIAILLRLNSVVGEYADFLASYDIKTSVTGDCLANKNLYKIVFETLNLIQNPENNAIVENIARLYNVMNIKHISDNDFERIKSLSEPFIDCNAEEFESEGLTQLHWDIDYILNGFRGDIANTALKTAIFYSGNKSERSNACIIGSFFKKIAASASSFVDVLEKAQYCAYKSDATQSFFEEESEDCSVKIMTLHKSKGSEYDYVFIPELSASNLPVTIKDVKLKGGEHFVQTVKNAVCGCGIKTPEQLKTDIINENLRLLYVGITRAKKGLYMSYSENGKRKKHSAPVEILDKLINFG